MVEISIIVPVYNLEEYLPRCIDSILDQTFINFELILVNDGSTDNSKEICDSYARFDNRITVVHKENGGVASSRNTGIKLAKGKYIGFVDNDDYINKYMFEILYNNAVKYSSDIVICEFLKVSEKELSTTWEYKANYNVKHYTNTQALNQLYTTNNVTFVVPWNKLYKRHLFEDIKYKHGNSNDDETVAHKLLYYSEKTTFIKTGLYYYIQRTGSQMDSNSVFHIKKLDAVYALKNREVFFRKKRERELQQKALIQYMDRFFRYYQLAKNNLQNIEGDLKKLKRTFDKSLILLLRHKELNKKQKFMCIIFTASPALFNFINVRIEKYKRSRQTKINERI